jgi:glycogen synthase
VAALQATLARLMKDYDAHTALVRDAAAIRSNMLDRSLGWGSCLARVLTG